MFYWTIFTRPSLLGRILLGSRIRWLGAGWLGAGWLGSGWLGAGWLGLGPGGFEVLVRLGRWREGRLQVEFP